MREVLILLAIVALLPWSCAQEPAPVVEPAPNPFFSEWDTPFGVPPFGKIKEDHYMPAFMEGMQFDFADFGLTKGAPFFGRFNAVKFN